MEGRIFVLIGPSGVGKTTLAEKVQGDHVAERIITCTTRPPRPHEVPDRDYFFLTLDDFERRQSNGEFVENEWIHGNRYGVLARELSRVVEAGHTAVISLGYGGAARVKDLWPQHVTIVGILPPSPNSLIERLRDRGTTAEELAVRLKAVEDEARTVRQLADVTVVNDLLDHAYSVLSSLLTRSRR